MALAMDKGEVGPPQATRSPLRGDGTLILLPTPHHQGAFRPSLRFPW